MSNRLCTFLQFALTFLFGAVFAILADGMWNATYAIGKLLSSISRK